MGYLGVKTMVAHLKGSRSRSASTPACSWSRASNMDDPDVKELLQPDLSKWLKP